MICVGSFSNVFILFFFLYVPPYRAMAFVVTKPERLRFISQTFLYYEPSPAPGSTNEKNRGFKRKGFFVPMQPCGQMITGKYHPVIRGADAVHVCFFCIFFFSKQPSGGFDNPRGVFSACVPEAFCTIKTSPPFFFLLADFPRFLLW